MDIFNSLHKRCISSEKLAWQIFGALIKWRKWSFWAFIIIVIPLTAGISFILSPNNYKPWFFLFFLNLIVWLAVKICFQLIDVFSLRKNDNGITWCYISVLVIFVFWIICFALIFDIKANDKLVLSLGVLGSLLTWIFQDRIRGAVTFIHLRINHLLNLGDWIVVPKYNVDGEVKRISLTTVTVFNWDTTISNIPLNALYTEHFLNFQHMANGNTYGRKMSKTFILDTSWFRLLSHEEIQKLRDHINEYSKEHEAINELGADAIHDNLPLCEIEEEMLNVRLFRIYFFHWLMNHKHVSQLPRLVVRWQDQIEGGMPLEVYAFITETSLAAYQHHQSHIVEHFIESLDWFGLRLYQAPSAFDVNNRRVYISQETPSYIKEITDEI